METAIQQDKGGNTQTYDAKAYKKEWARQNREKNRNNPEYQARIKAAQAKHNKNRKKLSDSEREKRNARRRELRQLNHSIVLIKEAEYVSRNATYISNYKKNWTKNNPDKIAAIRQKRKTDPYYIVKKRLDGRIRNVFRYHGMKKNEFTEKLLGCSIEEFRKYIQSKFLSGMSWENKSEWHIDHIKPCKSFNFSNQEEIYKCFHYTNLQVLWAIDNLKKGAKIL